MLQFDGALTITHGSGIELPGAANLTTAAGDRLICYATAANTVEVMSVELETVASAGITLGTEQATTSGTAINFTGIASGTKRITINLTGVSTDSGNKLLLQIGDSGGLETSGYISTAGRIISTTITVANATNGFVMKSDIAGDITSGTMTLILEDSTNNTWISAHTMKNNTTNVMWGGGEKSLSGELDRLTLTMTASENFDAGAVNITTE